MDDTAWEKDYVWREPAAGECWRNRNRHSNPNSGQNYGGLWWLLALRLFGLEQFEGTLDVIEVVVGVGVAGAERHVA